MTPDDTARRAATWEEHLARGHAFAVPAAPACPLPADDDPADALARQELAAPSGPAARWRPELGDPLAEGLLAGAADAPRQRRLAAFAADPGAHVTGWRLATLIRAVGADVALAPDGLIAPTRFNVLPPFLRDEARRERGALAAWLAIEADTGAPPEVLRDCRPPTGAAEALREHRDWCACCGLPPAGAVARWWAAPGSREWRCELCVPPPDDDDRTRIAYGRSGDHPAPTAPRAAPGTPHAR